MQKKIALFAMLFSMILLSSPLVGNFAFAASDDKDKKPNLTTCLSSLGNLDSRSFEDILKCLHDAAGSALSAGSLGAVKDAIRALISAVTHEHDERKIADTNLQNQINHIQLIPGPQGDKGDKGDPATFSTQTCHAGEFMIGIKSDGTIICQTLSQVPADGTPCNDNNPNTINDVYLGGVCQGTASGQACTTSPPLVSGDCRQVACVNGQLVTTIDPSDLPSNNGNSCVIPVCYNGVAQLPPASSGTACSINGGIQCDGQGSCVLPSCPSGQLMCGNTCTDIQSDANNCNGCGQACGAGAVCVSGVCTCPAGQISCQGGVCTDTSSDVNNCGGCGIVCTGSGGTPTCQSGTCSIQCSPGLRSCGDICLPPNQNCP